MTAPDRLIRSSRAPARVRAGLDKLLATGAPLATVDEAILRRLVRLFESSRFCAEVLRSCDEAWEILETGVYVPPAALPTPEDVRRHLALSLFHIAALDILDLAPFSLTLEKLSSTADECLEASWRIAHGDLAARYGRPEGCGDVNPGFVVFGLGKLGGRELNFSSDIDLIFAYGSDGETAGGTKGRLTHAEWYTRAAERVPEILSSRLLGLYAYRVDMRLRPEGKSGPLTRSLESTLRYYESSGATWERQALIRARACAGDVELGNRLLASLSPFVYRRYLDRDAISRIESIKAKIEAQASEYGQRHVKLSAGGIREIEFIVQILQLSHGGRCEAVRTPSTLEALARLTEHNYLLPEDRAELEEAYLFLRRLEHRIQMLDARQTHLLPEDASEMDALASSLGFVDGEALWRRYGEVTGAVRGFYERRFARSKMISVTAIEEQVMRVLDDLPEAPRVAAEGELSFGGEAASELRRMSQGSSSDPQTSATRLAFIRSTPAWLPRLYALPEPENALKRFARMIEAYGAKATVYEILAAHPAVAELLVNIAALSEPLSAQVCRDPSALEALLSPGGVTGEREASFLRDRMDSFRRAIRDEARAGLVLKGEESLRVGVRFLMGIADARSAGEDLAAMAELLLGETDFAVVALGRFGARDLGFTSDLDLVFVVEEGAESASRAVQAATDRWARLGLKIDARLRPMGRTSPLVSDRAALRDYFHGRAETWERVAWARARAVAGPTELRSAVEAEIRSFLFDAPFGRKELEEMAAMRSRLRHEATAETVFKRGHGGTIDVDFLCAVKRILGRSEDTRPERLLADRPDLVGAHAFLRTLESCGQIVTGRGYRGDEDEGDRARIARLLERHGLSMETLDRERSVVAAAALDAPGTVDALLSEA